MSNDKNYEINAKEDCGCKSSRPSMPSEKDLRRYEKMLETDDLGFEAKRKFIHDWYLQREKEVEKFYNKMDKDDQDEDIKITISGCHPGMHIHISID